MHLELAEKKRRAATAARLHVGGLSRLRGWLWFWRDEGQELEGAGLAVLEGAAELAFDEEPPCDLAEGSEGQIVFDDVAEEGAVDGGAAVAGTRVGARFSAEAMAMAPVGEGSAELDVAEVIVPGEFCDLGIPGDTDGGVREGTEADGHAGAGSSSYAVETQRRLSRRRARRRRCKGGLLDAGFLPGGHEAGEIFGVGEEGECRFNRVGEPLLGMEGVGHLFAL